jgi:hypothetical protein
MKSTCKIIGALGVLICMAEGCYAQKQACNRLCGIDADYSLCLSSEIFNELSFFTDISGDRKLCRDMNLVSDVNIKNLKEAGCAFVLTNVDRFFPVPTARRLTSVRNRLFGENPTSGCGYPNRISISVVARPALPCINMIYNLT